MEAPSRSSKADVAATDGRGLRCHCECCLRRCPGPVSLEIATTLRRSCAPESEWVTYITDCRPYSNETSNASTMFLGYQSDCDISNNIWLTLTSGIVGYVTIGMPNPENMPPTLRVYGSLRVQYASLIWLILMMMMMIITINEADFICKIYKPMWGSQKTGCNVT